MFQGYGHSKWLQNKLSFNTFMVTAIAFALTPNCCLLPSPGHGTCCALPSCGGWRLHVVFPPVFTSGIVGLGYKTNTY